MFLMVNYCRYMFRLPFLDYLQGAHNFVHRLTNLAKSFTFMNKILNYNIIKLLEILNTSLHDIKSSQVDAYVICCVQTASG